MSGILLSTSHVTVVRLVLKIRPGEGTRKESENMVVKVGSPAPNFVAEAYVRGEPEPRKIQLSGS